MLASAHQKRSSEKVSSQRFSQVGITLYELVKVVGKTKELLNSVQASRSWPVDHRLHLLGIRFDAILANDVTQVRELSLSLNTFRRFEQQFVLAQLRQESQCAPCAHQQIC